MSDVVDAPSRPGRSRAPRDALVVVLAFVVLGLVVGVLWPWLADPVVVTRGDGTLPVSEEEWSHQFSAVGWFTVLGAAGSFLWSVALMRARRSHELVTLLCILGGSLLAAVLAARLGAALGPADAARVLASAEVGATAPAAMDVDAPAAYLVWPLLATLGALAVMQLTPPADQR